VHRPIAVEAREHAGLGGLVAVTIADLVRAAVHARALAWIHLTDDLGFLIIVCTTDCHGAKGDCQ
jgi:hypothetical protein